jgi:hypothetical protein
MIVRIRLSQGQPIQRKHGKNRHLALTAGALLMPAALMAYVLGFWRLLADLGFAGQFAITGSAFSHWQVWIPVAVMLQFAAVALNRYGRGMQITIPRTFLVFQSEERNGNATRVGTR